MERAPDGHRLFLALRPPPDAAARIGDVRDALQPHGHVANERLHMTMGLLEDMATLDESIVARARDALATIKAAPVHLCLDRLSTSSKTTCLVPEGRPPALMELQRKIETAFVGAGLPLASYWSFNPHVTLLYKPREKVSDAIMPISWRADELLLVYSLIGLTQHIVLARLPLTSAA